MVSKTEKIIRLFINNLKVIQKTTINLFWFRRDLRLDDNVGLYHALQAGASVLPIFIFDTDILEKLENKNDRRVDYIHQAVNFINQELEKHGSKLNTYIGKPAEIFQNLHSGYDIEAVLLQPGL